MANGSNSILFMSLGFGAGVGTLLVTFFWKQWKRRCAAWQTFASQRGLRFHETPGVFKYSPGTLTMQGLYQGFPLLLFTEYRGSGKNRHLVTVLRLELGAALPPGLIVKPERLGDKVLKLFGVRDEEVGDAALDDAFDLKNVTPRAHAMLVSPRVRGPLIKLGRAYSGFSLESGFLQVEKGEMPETAAELEAFMAPALLLARAVHATEEYTGARMRG